MIFSFIISTEVDQLLDEYQAYGNDFPKLKRGSLLIAFFVKKEVV
jgi:hypothetical protein